MNLSTATAASGFDAALGLDDLTLEVGTIAKEGDGGTPGAVHPTEMVSPHDGGHRASFPRRRIISLEQARLCKAWLTLHYVAWKGKWPKGSAWDEEINSNLATIGISKVQANRQLLSLRAEHNERRACGEVEASPVSLCVADYKALLAESVDSIQILDDALLFLEKGSFFEFRPSSAALLGELRHWYEFLRDAVSNYLLSLCGFSADLWGEGGPRAALNYEYKRWKVALPSFQAAYMKAAREHAPNSSSRPDMLCVATQLESALHAGFKDAIHSPLRPAICDAPYAPRTVFSFGDRETIAYIAGYVLFRVHAEFASSFDQVGQWCKMLVCVCSVPEIVAKTGGVPVAKIKLKSEGRLRFPAYQFMLFMEAIEAVYVLNSTSDYLDAYGTKLLVAVRDQVKTSVTVRRVFTESVKPCLPLEYQEQPVPEAFFELVFEKYSFMRVKDIARSLSRAHATGAGLKDGGSGTIAHRAVVAVVSQQKKKR